MKFCIPNVSFSAFLSTLKSMTTNRGAMVYSGIMLDAHGGVLTMTASNGSSVLKVDCDATIIEEGKAIAPAMISDIASRFSGEETYVELDGNKIKLENKNANSRKANSKSSLSIIPGVMPEMKTEEGMKLKMPAKEFKSVFDAVAFAMGRDENKRSLTGVHLKSTATGIDVVATNGFILAKTMINIPDAANTDPISCVIPAAAIQTILKIKGNDASLCIGKTNITYECGEFRYSSPLIADAYPNYNAILDRIDSKARASLVKEDIENAIDVTNVFGSKNVLRLKFTNESLQMSSQCQIGSSVTEVPCSMDGVETLETAVNADYLRNALKSFDDEEIVFEMNEGSSIVITNGKVGRLCLVLPVKVANQAAA